MATLALAGAWAVYFSKEEEIIGGRDLSGLFFADREGLVSPFKSRLFAEIKVGEKMLPEISEEFARALVRLGRDKVSEDGGLH